jgi:hypothetical protein
LNTDFGYKGVTHLYNEKNEMIFAKHITFNIENKNEDIFLGKDFRTQKGDYLQKWVKDCKTETIYHYKDWYRVYRDAYGNIIRTEYSHTEYLGSSTQQVCTDKWIPDYIEGGGSGYYKLPCNTVDEGGNCISGGGINLVEDFSYDCTGIISSICSRNIPLDMKESLELYTESSILFSYDEFDWALNHKEEFNRLAQVLKIASNSGNYNEMRAARSFVLYLLELFYNNSFFSLHNINFEEQIINNLTGKEKCVYDKLKKLNLFKATIKKFEGNSNYNLTIENGNCNNTNTACTDGSRINIGNIKITMEILSGNLPLNYAATLLHEGIHAEIFKYINEYKKGLDPNKRANLLYHYFQQKKIQKPSLVNSVAQHQHMADKFVKPIANAIRILDNYQYPLEYYMGFGWDGLRAYGYDGYYDNGNWVNLSKDQSTEYYKKQKIVNDNTKLKGNECK